MIAALLVISPLAANADPITVDFSVTGTSGPLTGVMSSGFFTFDDSVIPGGGGLVSQIGLLTDLSFVWNGIGYDETTANTGWLSFDALETLDDFGFGTDCWAAGCRLFPQITGFILAGPIFHYSTTTDAGSGTYDGVGEFTTQVPEPGTLALLGIGLFGMGLARRKKV
jgi:hypothetical protein